MSKTNKLIDLRAWHGRGEGYFSLFLSFVKYPVYLGALKFIFPFIPLENEVLFILGIMMAFMKIIVGYLDYRRGLMLKETERMTWKYNPYFDKLQSKLEVIHDKLNRYLEGNNEIIRQLNILADPRANRVTKIDKKLVDHSGIVDRRYCKFAKRGCGVKLKYCNVIMRKCDVK